MFTREKPGSKCVVESNTKIIRYMREVRALPCGHSCLGWVESTTSSSHGHIPSFLPGRPHNDVSCFAGPNGAPGPCQCHSFLFRQKIGQIYKQDYPLHWPGLWSPELYSQLYVIRLVQKSTIRSAQWGRYWPTKLNYVYFKWICPNARNGSKFASTITRPKFVCACVSFLACSFWVDLEFDMKHDNRVANIRLTILRNCDILNYYHHP